MRLFWIFLASIVLGLWLGLIHPPFQFHIFAFLSLIPLFLLVKKTGRPILIGYGYGFGYFLFTMQWIREPFLVGPAEYLWMGPFAWILMAAGLALFWLPIWYFYERGIWAVALIFFLMESLRGYIFTGLPWGLLAYGLIDTPLSNLAALYGSFLLSSLIVFMPLALIFPVKNFERWLALGLIGLSAAWFFFRAPPSDSSFADLTIQLVQPNFTQDELRNSEKALENIENLIQMSAGDSDWIIWPEAAIRYQPVNDPQLVEFLSQNFPNRVLIFGAPTIENGNFYNSAFVLSGDNLQRYDKRHLVPFGEYIPFGDYLLENGFFVRTVTSFNARKGSKIPWQSEIHPRPNILICYEGIFPKYARRTGDVLVNISNDNWFGQVTGPQQHLISERFRSIESGKPMARASMSGISALIDANGQIIEEIPLKTRDSITGQLGNAYQTTIYHIMGDKFWNILASILLLFLLYTQMKTAKSKIRSKNLID